MAIPIHNHKLTPEQYLKLYSNPVSGIACDMNGAGTNYDYAHMGRFHLKNIRYSKSMILKALEFWYSNVSKYSKRIYKIYNPLINVNNQIWNHMGEIAEMYNMIKDECPDTFLFSHRHIQDKWDGVKTGYKYSKSMNIQLELLNKKYPILKDDCEQYGFQESTMDPYYRFKTDVGIEFTVFPNEHPYIPRQKISRVGMTEKGNAYIMMDNGAYKK